MTEDQKKSCGIVAQELVGKPLLSPEDFNALCSKHGVDPDVVRLYNSAVIYGIFGS